jgi:flagellar motor switch protein FliM
MQHGGNLRYAWNKLVEFERISSIEIQNSIDNVDTSNSIVALILGLYGLDKSESEPRKLALLR